MAGDRATTQHRPWTAWLRMCSPVVGSVAVITLVGFVLRVIGLNSQLWYDEIFSLVVSSRPPLRDILTTYYGDIQHPLYSVLVNISIHFLGEAPWTVRLPSVIFGIASIPLLYRVCQTISAASDGLLAAALLAVSYHHVWFSQNARGYAALLFWTLLCTLFFYRGLEERRWPPFLAYSVAASLGAYTHPTFVFVVIGHAAAILASAVQTYRDGREFRSLLAIPMAAIVLSGILTLALYSPIVSQLIHYYRTSSGKMKAVSTPGWAVIEALNGLELGLGSRLALVVLALLIGCGVWGYWKENRRAFFVLVFPTAAVGVGIVAMQGSMYPRYLFMLFGFGIVIAVRGAMVLGACVGRVGNARSSVVGQMIGIGCMVLVITASAVMLGRVYRLPKQDFRGALQFVETHRQAAEIVLTAGAAAWPYQNYYGRNWPEIRNVEQIERLGRQTGRVWLLYTFPRYIEHETPGLMDAIDRRFKTIRVFTGTLGHGDVFVCVKDVSEPAPG